MTTAPTEADGHLREAITRQLERDSGIDARGIGVTAHDGTVTLTGYVNSCAAKLAAERGAKRIRGVRAVANDIRVRHIVERTDTDIAADVVKALDLYSATPECVQAVVHNGHVTLTGRVAWMFQKRDAEKVVRHVGGVRGVMNYVAVEPSSLARDVRDSIVGVLHRNGTIDPHGITVRISDDVATLSGIVRTWLERETAERVAADAPSISRVENQIVVDLSEPSIRDSLDAI